MNLGLPPEQGGCAETQGALPELLHKTSATDGFGGDGGASGRGRPIIAVEDLPDLWGKYQNPILLTAVRARSAAPLISAQLNDLRLVEGQDWWRAA